jgi:hypothetical protein
MLTRKRQRYVVYRHKLPVIARSTFFLRADNPRRCNTVVAGIGAGAGGDGTSVSLYEAAPGRSLVVVSWYLKKILFKIEL